MGSEITFQQDTNAGTSLPFSGLGDSDFGHVISGPRISLRQYKPKAFYSGLVTIRNYLAGHTKKSLRLGAKRVSDLKAFVLDLPVELQLLVLEHLHPIDLYHFSQVSRYFRQLVLDPAVRPVWKTAFTRHPDLPTPPPGVKEPEWAFMIYGPGICGLCGKYGALTDFSLLKRFCGPCQSAHILPCTRFIDISNNTISRDHVMWELIPYTERCTGIRYNMGSHGTPRFLKTDISIMWKKLELIRILLMNGLRVLSPLYTDYITSRKGYIRRLNDSAGKSNAWAIRIIRQLGDECDALPNQLTIKCKTRLQSLGYDERDIGHASYPIRHLLHEKAILRLTRRTFREIRPRIESILKSYRSERIKSERQKLLLQIYRDYLKARAPDEWSFLPDVNTQSILDSELFEKFLRAPCDESANITPGSVVPFLSKFIENWIKARREQFLDLLPNDPDETLEAKVQRLGLVTFVVTCRSCTDPPRSLVGWKTICRHQLNSKGIFQRCIYAISRHAVTAATSLVSCVGLDPLTTTVDDMNLRNDRFMCGNCSPEVRHGRRSRRVYTWLECVEHTTAHCPDNGSNVVDANPVWLPLSAAAAQFVRAQEKPYPDPSSSVWRCNHCAHHFDKQTLQADAIDHVKKVHCIRIPVIGVDVVADLREPIPKRREPFRLSLDPAYDHICKHCTDVPVPRLWEKRTLMMHLIKKHRVLKPAEHVDWGTVPIVAPSAALVPT